MRKKQFWMFIALAIATTMAARSAAIAADEPEGFKTARPAMLEPLAPEVKIEPILSTGDVVGGTLGGFQFSGIPDGIGAYKSSASTIDVLVNHELAGSAPAGVGARVSQLQISKDRRVLAARHAVNGTEGFLRFCSSTLALIDGVPWYFTGEESTNSGPAPSGGRGGSSIALNAQTGRWYETRHFGLFAHENVTPVKGLPVAFVLSGEDGSAGLSQLYAYTAPTFAGAIRGEGQLWVWKANITPADGNASTNDIQKGSEMPGEFVPVTQVENATAASLEAASQAKGAFDFVRIEDAAVSRTGRPGVLYFVDTGAAGAETVKGRAYKFEISQNDPTKASLRLLLDGDKGDDLVNPDNIDVSEKVMVIQEDRNSEHRDANVAGGYGRILVYDLKKGGIKPVARVATPAGLRPGEWESSGVVNAFSLLGAGWWIVDVQAHGQNAPQPAVSGEVGSGTGEDGQLLAIRIPGS